MHTKNKFSPQATSTHFKENVACYFEVQPVSGSPKVNHAEGHRGRLRERFLKNGLEGFADYEVVELILTLCIPRKDVKQPAKKLIEKFGNLRNIFDASLEEFEDIHGIGEVAPIALKIIKSAATLYLQQSAEEYTVLNSTDKLERFWRLRLGSLKHEVFEVAFLDNSFRLSKNGIERLEEGIVDRTQVYPRKVMEYALRHYATGIVIAHNHPSGKAYPSEQDQKLTQAIIQAGKTLGIRLIDHVLVTADTTFSFKRAGLIE